jgi:hypothetical protein
MAWSAVDDCHVRLVVALACGRCEVVQPFDLLGAELDATPTHIGVGEYDVVDQIEVSRHWRVIDGELPSGACHGSGDVRHAPGGIGQVEAGKKVSSAGAGALRDDADCVSRSVKAVPGCGPRALGAV